MTYGDASLSTDASSQKSGAGLAAVCTSTGRTDSGPEARNPYILDPDLSIRHVRQVYNAERFVLQSGTESIDGFRRFSYWVKYTAAASTHP